VDCSVRNTKNKKSNTNYKASTFLHDSRLHSHWSSQQSNELGRCFTATALPCVVRNNYFQHGETIKHQRQNKIVVHWPLRLARPDTADANTDRLDLFWEVSHDRFSRHKRPTKITRIHLSRWKVAACRHGAGGISIYVLTVENANWRASDSWCKRCLRVPSSR